MDYKVVPFVAKISGNDSSANVANQLEVLINSMKSENWEYVGLEKVDTLIKGDSGCFGYGATPDRFNSFMVAIFKK